MNRQYLQNERYIQRKKRGSRYPKQFVPELLKQLGLPKTALWEDAAPKVRREIVEARKLDLDDHAKRWSEAKALLKQRLRHRCPNCKNVVSAKAHLCTLCANDRRKDIPRPRKPLGTITVLTQRFVEEIQRPFFSVEACFWVHQQCPGLDRTATGRTVYQSLRKMVTMGIITERHRKDWRRFEKVTRPLSS